MNWYIAKMVFSIQSDKAPEMAQFDQQLRLISAENGMEALQRARAAGKEEENILIAETNGTLVWKFIAVEELHEVKLKDGEELSSRIHETDDAATYMQYVRQKSEEMEARLKSQPRENKSAPHWLSGRVVGEVQ
jgi:CHASE3 domain sensor protein